METNRRALMKGSALGVGGAALAMAASGSVVAGGVGSGLTADQALERLREGNRLFVADRSRTPDISTGRRLAIAKGQAPFATLVGCADSRVGPEHLFGAGLGELFIVRTAGNYVDDAGFGSIAYSVAELKVPLIVVLGHERCGAVAAANAVVSENAALPPSLMRMVQPILPSAIDARARLKPGEDLLDKAVHFNVRRVADLLRSSSDPILAEPIRAGKVRVVGAYYDLDTGNVNFFYT